MPSPAEYKRLTETVDKKWSGDEGQRRAVHPYVQPAKPEAEKTYNLGSEREAIKNLPKGDL